MTRIEVGAEKAKKKVPNEMFSSMLFVVKVAFFWLHSYVFYTVQVCILYHLQIVKYLTSKVTFL